MHWGIDQAKITILSLFTHRFMQSQSHVFLSSVEHKKENVLKDIHAAYFYIYIYIKKKAIQVQNCIIKAEKSLW